MINIFKNYNPFNFVFVILFSLIFWSYQLFFDEYQYIPSFENEMPLFFYFSNFIFGFNSKFLSYLISFILIIIQLLIVIRIDAKYLFSHSRNFFTGFIFILLSSISVITNHFSSIFFANIFLLLALKRVFEAYNKEKILSNFFDASFLISLASLFYFNSIFLIIFLFIATLILKSTPIKEWIVIIAGILMVYAIFFEIYFIIFGNVNGLFLIIKQTFSKQFQFNFSNLQFITSSVIFSVITLFSFFYFLKVSHTLNLYIRVFFRISIILFLVISVIFILAGTKNFELILFAVFPISIIASNFLINAKRKKITELFFWLFFFSILFVHTIKIINIF